MNYVGVSCGYHDASVAVIDHSGNILFAGHSERYSSIKHDRELNTDIIEDAAQYITGPVKYLSYYEKPWLKYLRGLYSGELPRLSSIFPKNIVGHRVLEKLGVTKIKTHPHHLSHAAAGFQTSPFNDATVVVIDAIGEWDTATIWSAEYVNGIAQYKKLWSLKYPNSIGLFYSAMTARVGLRPLDEEYILMGMAGWGDGHLYSHLRESILDNIEELRFKDNLHLGVDHNFMGGCSDVNIAAASQVVLEELIQIVFKKARELGTSSNLVYGGGVALNCLANRLLGKYYTNIWIMPNPGDAGSSLGAAALDWGKKITWVNSYLGYDISGEYPVEQLVVDLAMGGIAGVANGRAEWGPRALGNRSLLADPRGPHIKDRVNTIKQRQKFRPFAPAILEEWVHEYFEMPPAWDNSRYMQVIGTCREPNKYPAISHVDGTSRIQTVPKDGSGIRILLERWFEQTGCPMLLNTSLNIRGYPMVNNRSDADKFSQTYGIPVFT